MSTVYSGLCRGGPMDGKTKALQDMKKFVVPNDPTGFYVYAPAVRGGAEPPGWRWIASPPKQEPTVNA